MAADPIKNLDLRRASSGGRGRHFKRAGASMRGTLSNWISSMINARTAERERLKIANRAWDLYVNDAMGHGIIEGLISQVVNIGLTPQPDPMISWLGFDREWQEKYATKSYDLFEIWGLDSRNWCDAQRRCNIYMLQALAFFQWKLEGVGVFQILFQEAPYKPLGLTLLPIDPGRLTTPTDAGTDKEIYDGIELGKNGEIEAIWILKETESAYQYAAKSDSCYRIKARNDRHGLPNVLVICDVRNVAEYRQDSILGPMIKEIKDSNDFVDAALVKSLISNLWTAFVESESEAGRLLNQQGSAPGTALTATDWDERIQEMEKGTIIAGFPGEKANFLTSDAPGQNYEKMNESIIGRIGMSTGRGAENTAKSYKSSYSASRASIEDAAKADDYDRTIMVNRFCQPFFSWLQYEAATKSLLPISSITHFLQNMYAYTRTSWLKPPLRPIDHAKEAKADSERLKNHTKTYSEIFGEQSADWKTKLRQRAIELKFIKELEAEFDIDLSVKPAKAIMPEEN